MRRLRRRDWSRWPNAIQDRGARDIAKRALETVGQVFRYGIAHGYSKRNPSSEIRPSDILKPTPQGQLCPCRR